MTFTHRVATYFQAWPNRWLNATEFERIGGRQAWRTRISECRTRLGMRIENRVSTKQLPSGEKFTVSEYRFVPKEG